jgi:hypothetical protein
MVVSPGLLYLVAVSYRALAKEREVWFLPSRFLGRPYEPIVPLVAAAVFANVPGPLLGQADTVLLP